MALVKQSVCETESLLDGAVCPQYFDSRPYPNFLCEYLVDYDYMNVMAHTHFHENADFTYQLNGGKTVQTVFI